MGRHEVVGAVRVGIIGTTARWLTPLLLECLTEVHPRVHLVVGEGTSTTLEPQLSTGVIDIAVVNLPQTDADLVATPLFDEDLILVVPPDHPLAGGLRSSCATSTDSSCCCRRRAAPTARSSTTLPATPG